MIQNFKCLEILKGIQQKDGSSKFDNIFVLAHGKPYLPLSALSIDSKIRVLSVMVLATDNRKTDICFVGGGALEGDGSVATQMSDYFDRINRSNDNLLSNNTYILKKSNNTVDNVKEILDSLDTESVKQKNIAIISNDYHTSRIREITRRLGSDMNVLSAEDILLTVSDHHADIIKKYKASLEYRGKKIRDKLMSLYLKIDPNESLVEKIVRMYQKWRIK